MVKKGLITLSAVAALTTSAFAGGDADLAAQIAAMKKQIATLEAKLDDTANKVKKVDKLAKKATKKANFAKMLANKDNLKFSVDFRTAIDQIEYKMTDGTTKKNDGLMTNRLWLKAAYAPSENVSFRSTLAYNKAYGDTANHSQSNTNPGYANFDWVTNENALGNELKIKEAYWLYTNDTFLDTDVSWTASVGRRPSTGGQGINLREGEGEQSPLGHSINVEFDGASFKFNLDKVTPLTGGWIKLCMGRGLTNATTRFSSDGADYATDTSKHNNVDMVGFIFVPYDDGQYSVNTQWSVAKNMIGFDSNGTHYKAADGTFTADGVSVMPAFQDVGDLELANVMFKANGIGDGINDFLDDTSLIASWAQSKTKPNVGQYMIGSGESQTGHSEWIALNMPAGEDARFGLEWNQGSRYWRSVTYGEDTMVGSKLAARGSAVEVYYNRSLTKALSMSLRATKIDYDYTGSQAFFGAEGHATPIDLAPQTTVKEAKDIRFAITYKY